MVDRGSMKIWELDRTKGKRYKIVNTPVEVEPWVKCNWIINSDKDLISEKTDRDITDCFNSNDLLELEFEEVKELTGYERVKKGETYYYFDNANSISKKIEGQIRTVTTTENLSIDDRRSASGNYFSTLETARKEVRIIGLYQKLKRFSVENGWDDSMLLDREIRKYCIMYAPDTQNGLRINFEHLPILGTVYFKSELVAKKAIEQFGQEWIGLYKKESRE